MTPVTITRRAFLASTTLAATAALAADTPKMNPARVVPGKHSPNEQVIAAFIGTGGRATSVADTCPDVPNLRIVAACDCFRPKLNSFMNGVGKDKGWNGYLDFREMLDKENLDGVLVETNTHQRAYIACAAMASGLDAYIEKPMALTIAEGRHLVNVARKYKRVTQVGTQQRSMPLNNWVSDLVKGGVLGNINVVRAPNFIGPRKYTNQETQPLPDGGWKKWWDVWTNQAVLRPYHSEMQQGWATWDDYDGGGISFGVTGWGAHSYDQINRGLGTDETGPVEVALLEEVQERRSGEFKPRTISDRETGRQYYCDATGPRANIHMKFKNGTELHLDLDADWGPGLGCIFVGEKGTIELNRSMVSADPDILTGRADWPQPMGVKETQPHLKNWVDCIKSREKCNADIEYGQRSNTLCCLVNIVRAMGRVGESLKWDPKKERFKNCDTGNLMLARTRRKGYELPT